MLLRSGFSTAIATLLVCCAVPAGAVVLGGGLTRSDCTIAFDGVDATDGDSAVVCHDGDPTCDTDGAVDGVCHFTVSLCAHLSSPGCTAAAVNAVKVGGLPLEAPDLPVTSKTCAAVDPLAVPMDTAVGATTVATQSGALKDVDYLNLCCRGTVHALDAPLCATGVELSIAGCRRPPGKGLERPWHKARTLVDQAAHEPARAKKLLKGAARAITRMKTRAQRLATVDVCGNGLGSIATHALATINNR